MIDFEKLTENIKAVNEVLNDLETEITVIKQNVDCKKSDAFEIMYNDVLKYILLILQANNGKSTIFGFETTFDNGYQIRIANDWHCGTYVYCLKVRKGCSDDWYPIWIYNPNEAYKEYIFESLNRSCKSVQWLVDVVAMNWDEYKIKLENLIATYINDVIVKRSKKMHKEYESISNEAKKLNV